MTSLWYALALALGVSILYMSMWFVVALAKKRNDVVDVAWGLGFVLVAMIPIVLYGPMYRALFVTTLILIWGIRLSYHIYSRNSGAPEDARYAAWRKKWGDQLLVRSYFQIFALQALLLVIIALPVLVLNTYDGGGIQIWDIVGGLVWLGGFLSEAIGDAQLRAFVKNKDNAGKIMTSGLWRYTRHPNYFGEVTMWWGIWIISLGVPHGPLTIIGPLLITYLILFVSGVPLLEKAFARRAGFLAYTRQTSKFIPWFPKEIPSKKRAHKKHTA